MEHDLSPRPLRLASALLVIGIALCAGAASADPIRARYLEGFAHGFIRLSDLAGTALASGELVQYLEKDVVVSRLLIRFEDGSLYDETVRFSQRPVFRLRSYTLTQHGPSFTESTDVSFSRNGDYRTRRRAAPDKEEERASGRMEMPEDLSNGMTSTLLKNLPEGTSATTHLLAFDPKPHVLEVDLVPEGSDPYWIGSASSSATRFRITPKVTGVTGALATVVGKQPSSLHMWIAQGKAPALVRFEGALYTDGPQWRIDPAGPRWQKP